MDRNSRPGLGARGIGGIVGVGAAMANAVFNAMGKRVHDLLITLDKLGYAKSCRWLTAIKLTFWHLSDSRPLTAGSTSILGL